MKIGIFLTVFVCAAWALPKNTAKLEFNRLYVDPLKPFPKNITPRIVSGEEVTPHSIPYQAYIIITGSGYSWLCGGSLISRRFVLTAAHCLIGGARAEIYLGAHNINLQTEPTRTVIHSYDLIPHNRYDGSSFSNDIGVIQLSAPVEFSEYINVVYLPNRPGNVDEYVGNLGRVSGWGLTEGDKNTSPVLLAVNSTIISNSVCNSFFGVVHDQHVCISGSTGAATCDGDSGGPLVVNNVQVGLVSYGTRGCIFGYPSAFTRINIFLDWLEANTDIIF